MDALKIVGLDIGGANIKAATNDGTCVCVPFPIWRQQHELASRLQQLSCGAFASPHLVALTMTAELADCFETREQGVRFVIRAVQQAFPRALLRIWLLSGEFADPDETLQVPLLAAAANWHALAAWSGRAVPEGPALLIDTGSTTTDIIPLLDGQVAAEGRTDLERLMHRELIYTGAVRTPVIAIVREVPVRDRMVPIAAELFATSRDIFLLAGDLPEQPDCCDTADGRPATRDYALNRVAHLLCCDRSDLRTEELIEVARFVASAQVQQISAAIEDRLRFLQFAEAESARRPRRRPVVLISGSGHFLVTRALSAIPRGDYDQILNLSEMYEGRAAVANCAFAAARLAADRCLDELLPLEPFRAS